MAGGAAARIARAEPNQESASPHQEPAAQREQGIPVEQRDGKQAPEILYSIATHFLNKGRPDDHRVRIL